MLYSRFRFLFFVVFLYLAFSFFWFLVIIMVFFLARLFSLVDTVLRMKRVLLMLSVYGCGIFSVHVYEFSLDPNVWHGYLNVFSWLWVCLFLLHVLYMNYL